MLSSHNILSPAHGRPLATPNQDIVLGCHYLTKPRGESLNPRAKEAKLAADDPRRLRAFNGIAEVRAAYDAGELPLHDLIAVRASGLDIARSNGDRGPWIQTTPGRVLFNEVVPRELGFINHTMDKKRLETLVGDCYSNLGPEITSDLLDALKDLGFRYATQAGFTVGVDDVRIPPEKHEIISKARAEVDQINLNYRGDRHLAARHDRRRGGHLRGPVQGPRRFQPDLHDGRLGIAR
jgi:DNA-directed RNA polymerase subunit beta'